MSTNAVRSSVVEPKFAWCSDRSRLRVVVEGANGRPQASRGVIPAFGVPLWQAHLLQRDAFACRCKNFKQ